MNKPLPTLSAYFEERLLAEQGKTATLEAEVRDLDAKLEDRTARVLVSSKEKCRYEIKALGYLDLLRELEWSVTREGPNATWLTCPICFAIEEHGHLDHCSIGNALEDSG